MSQPIEAYHYRIGLDVSSLQGGGVVTRRELGQIRRDLLSLQTPTEKSAAMLDRLTSALNKGAMDANQYAAAVGRIKATSQEAIAEKQRMLDVDKQVSTIRQKMTTDEERYQQEVKRTADLVKATRGTENPFTYEDAAAYLKTVSPTAKENAGRDNEASRIAAKWTPDDEKYLAKQAELDELMKNHGLTLQAYDAELKAFAATLPSVAEGRRQEAAAHAEVAKIIAANRTEEQQLQAERERLTTLNEKYNLSNEDMAAALERYQAGLPSSIAAEKEKAAALAEVARITKAGMTDDQLIAAEKQRLTVLEKEYGLSKAASAAQLKKYTDQLPSNIKLQQEVAAINKQAEAISARNETATEKYHRKLQELHKTYKTGELDAKNYLLVVKELSAEHDRSSASAGRGTSGGGGGGMLGSLGGRMGGKAGGVLGRVAGAGLLRMAGPIGAGLSVAKFAADGFSEYTKLQAAESNLEVFTGSAEKAKSLLTQLRGLSPTISMDSYAQASQTMLAYNVEAERVAPTLARLGDLAGGSGEKFDRLAYAVAEVTNIGKLQGGEFKQLMNAGFNPLRAYADATGESMESLRQKMKAGQFTAEMLHKAIEYATSEGGSHFGLLAKQSETVSGSFASLRSEVTALGASLMEPVAKGAGWLARVTASAVRFVRPKDLGPTMGDPTPLEIKDAKRKTGGGQYGITDEDIAKAEEKRNETLNQEIERLKTRNIELQKGAEWAKNYQLLNSGASETIQNEYKAIRDRNKELERAAQIAQQTEEIQKRIGQEREAIAIRSHFRIADEGVANQLAQLRILGATGTELEQHVAMHRELAQLERVRTAESEHYARGQQLQDKASSIRESFRTPMQSLAIEFRDLAEMYNHGLLTDDQYNQARMRSARELLGVHQQLATQTLGLDDGSSIYSAMIEDQNRRERAAIEQSQALQVQRQVDALVQKENERLVTQRQITEQMRQQALAAQAMQTSGAAGGQAAGPGGNSDHLDRIAAASERTAQALSKWQLVGV